MCVFIFFVKTSTINRYLVKCFEKRPAYRCIPGTAAPTWCIFTLLIDKRWYDSGATYGLHIHRYNMQFQCSTTECQTQPVICTLKISSNSIIMYLVCNTRLVRNVILMECLSSHVTTIHCRILLLSLLHWLHVRYGHKKSLHYSYILYPFVVRFVRQMLMKSEI